MSANRLNIWEELKNLLKQALNREDYNIWITPLASLKSTEEKLSLGCPNAFHRTWLNNNYLGMMRQQLKQINPAITLELQVMPRKVQTAEETRQDAQPRPQLLPLTHNSNLNPRFVFERFVSGQCNEFAWAAARALAKGKQVYANTLFLASSTGLGKSHLIQAVGHQVMNEMPSSRIAYLTAEDFTNQMIKSLRGNRIEAFKDRFRRDCDLLLLEEVQFLSGKDKTQDELSYTLDALMDAGKKIVFTSNCAPADIKGLKPQLISRMCSGLTASITPPDHETRVRILEKYCQHEAISINRPVLEYLAQENFSDIRKLHSALVGVVAKSSLTGRTLDISLAAEVLSHMAVRFKRVTPENIMEEVAKAYGLGTHDLSSKSRRRQITRPRNLAMFLCRKHTTASYASLGGLFSRDHATVIYGVEQVERNLRIDNKLAQEISFVEQRLGLS